MKLQQHTIKLCAEADLVKKGEEEDGCFEKVSNKCPCGKINKKLLISKCFYYFFWSAYGSFFPLLGVYYKQIGMNPTQSGLLVGCRPLLEFISAPSLSSLADKLNLRKVMIIVNLLCWIAFVFPLGMIKPSDKTCHRYIMLAKNISEFTSQESDEVNDFLKSNTPQEPQIHEHHKGTVVFSEDSIHKVFYVLLFLSVIGEFFASPAPTLADTATLNALGDDKDKYGRQRMFGSIGWGSAMFLVGFAIDALPEYMVCDVKISKDYTYAFYFFLGYMFCALLTATQFSFKDCSTDDETIQGSARDVINIFLQLNYFSTVVAAFYAGLGMGLTRVFLFWHLEDLGAPPTLFGLSSAMDHLAETLTYFFIEFILTKLSHVQVIYLGLLVNFVRFLLISYLVNPWFILPLDLLQGFSHAGVWAALTSYLSKAAPKGYRAAVQGILQGFYYGLGRAVGAIGGGIFAHYYGTNTTFRMYGFGSIPVFLFMFITVSIYNHRTKKLSESMMAPRTEKEGKTIEGGGGGSNGDRDVDIEKTTANDILNNDLKTSEFIFSETILTKSAFEELPIMKQHDSGDRDEIFHGEESIEANSPPPLMTSESMCQLNEENGEKVEKIENCD